jgi:hypothetical protein
MIRRREFKRKTNVAVKYEQKVLSTYLQKEAKRDRIELHMVASTLWVSACDFVTDLARRARKTLGVGYFAHRRKVENAKVLHRMR